MANPIAEFAPYRANTVKLDAFEIPGYENTRSLLSKEAARYRSKNYPDMFGRQNDALNFMSDAARGNGPSVAEQTLRNATNRNLSNTAALIASQRGAQNYGLGARQMMMQSANLGQEAAGQAAALRAQEMLAAREQYANQANAMRSQDDAMRMLDAEMTKFYTQQGFAYDIAKQQSAQALQELLSANQNQYDATVSGIGNSIRSAKAQKYAAPWGILSDKTKKTDVSNSNDSIRNFLDTLGRVSKYGNPTRGALSEGFKSTGDYLSSAGYPGIGSGMTEAGSFLSSPKSYLVDKGVGALNSISDAARSISSGISGASGMAGSGAAKMGSSGETASTSGGGGSTGSVGSAIGQYASSLISGLKSTAGNYQNTVKAPTTLQQTSVSPRAYEPPTYGDGEIPNNQGIIGAVITALTSDVGMKRDIIPISGGEEPPAPQYTDGLFESIKSDERSKKDKGGFDMNGFLDQLRAYSYRYKDPQTDGDGNNNAQGRHFGVMAQDLEKSDVGASMVRDTPRGKMIDMGKGFGVVLASLADLNKRLETMEGKKRRG